MSAVSVVSRSKRSSYSNINAILSLL